MNREDIIRMAREAGLDPDLWNYTNAFETFAALVAAAEREACAKLAELAEPYQTADLIRKRGTGMTGFKSKQAAAQAKLNDDDDIQDYKKPWVGLTDEEISARSKGHMTRNGFARAIEQALKAKNT